MPLQLTNSLKSSSTNDLVNTQPTPVNGIDAQALTQLLIEEMQAKVGSASSRVQAVANRMAL